MNLATLLSEQIIKLWNMCASKPYANHLIPMSVVLLSLLMSMVIMPQPVMALAMITECQNAVGLEYDLKPKNPSWHDVKLEKLKIVLMRVGMREYDVMIKYIDRDEIMRAHSPFLRHVFEDDNHLTISSLWPIGISETFQLSTMDTGQRVLFWNIMKNNTPPMKSTKVTTYTLTCDDK